MGTRLSEREFQSALDFCSKFFHPTPPQQRVRALQSGLPYSLFEVPASPADPKKIADTLDRAGTTKGARSTRTRQRSTS